MDNAYNLYNLEAKGLALKNNERLALRNEVTKGGESCEIS